jgi:hypothetical protein
MAIVEQLKVGGDNVLTSSDGKIIINQTVGDIIVRDSQDVRRLYIGSQSSPTGFGLYVSDPNVDVINELES